MNTPDRLHDLMRSQPEPAPPDSLWPRLLARRRQQVRRRRLAAATASTSLVAVLVAVLAWPDRFATPAPAPMPAHVAEAGTEARVEVQVRALDHALQAAYDRGASDGEVAPLWEARDALLASAGAGSSHAPNDI